MHIYRHTEPVRRRPWLAYPIALLCVLVAFSVRQLLGLQVGLVPYVTFVVAVVISTWIGGTGPGIFATIASAALAQYFLLGGSRSILPESGPEWVALLFYLFTCGLIIALQHGLYEALAAHRRTETALRELNGALEDRVAERTAALEAESRARSEAEARARHMQKMESLGQLTGGVAHDFNNMLAIIMGSLDIARRRLDEDVNPRVAQGIDNAMEGARRAAALTSRLLAFSRQQPLSPQAIDPNRLVAGMSELLHRTLGEHIRIETVLAGGLWPAFADPSELENAIVNLAVNSRDAMAGGGQLTIETANAFLDERYARSHAEVTPGQYVMISVTDTGSGMPPEVIERAFDPFFTTKGVGKGTGLGLSQVFGYVKQSRGHVKIYSEPGEGTTIKIYLPRHLGTAATGASAGPAAELPHGDRTVTVLVVEDEAEVRQMTVEALRELGYSVVEARNGTEALERLDDGSPVDLVFTDIVMPDMTGRQLADRVAGTHPHLPVLFTTGYTRNAVVHNGMLDPGVAFLPKPFTLEQLALKIADVLAGRGANRPE